MKKLSLLQAYSLNLGKITFWENTDLNWISWTASYFILFFSQIILVSKHSVLTLNSY